MSGLGLLIFGMIRAHSSELYPATLFMRVYFIACIVAFYAMTGDPLFLVLVGIVGLGFILTLFSYLTDRRKLARSPLAPRKRRMATFWRPAELSGDVVVEATVKSLRLRPRKKLISSSVAPTRNHTNMLVGCVAEVVG